MYNHCKSYIYAPKVIAIALMMMLGVAHALAKPKTDSPGKPRIALLGDSMTWIGGDSCQNATGWSHILKESGIARAIDVYARSGATWTNTKSTRCNPSHYTELLHDDNVIYNQAIRLIERADSSDASPDLIILFAGANDAWFTSKRPGMFDNAKTLNDNPTIRQPNLTTSLAGSIRLVGYMLRERFPEATLLFVAPLQMSKTDASSIHRVADIIEETASEIGYKTLRADKETGITHKQEKKHPKYTYDGVHSNPAGAKIIGDYIIRHIQSPKN
ncbi:MAG: SGNH/GDSL hydrolase family protein [Muribaculaceae bacterium]|nr:SGNH/GDSL hydrolase family protein [Muribaculaceae bacterium]